MSETVSSFNFAAGEVLLINKPLTWTSFDAVNRIRGTIKRHLGLKLKVGHAGTLDPLATGLLIICTGRATKSIEEYMGQEKEYTGTFVIGATTPCFDRERAIDSYFSTSHITEQSAKDATNQFTGKILQSPPVFSAIRIEGKRSYKNARAGEEKEPPPREVEIREFEITAFRKISTPEAPEGELIEIDFRVSCSKGTYIRSLARDFGRALGSGAFLGALCRTRIGNFRIEQSQTIDELTEKIHKMIRQEDSAK